MAQLRRAEFGDEELEQLAGALTELFGDDVVLAAIERTWLRGAP